MKTLLKLNKLAIFRGEHTLYAETFHDGVNIIHGDNGSGKSTILDFIFFALGGELKDWKPQAELADFVLAEVTAGETILTLRRDVSKEANRPMQIFFGPYEAAKSAGPVEWRLAPYKRQQDNFSFSQILFKAIGLPEAISDGASNITMHQVLRLLYSDQMTPIQRIFRIEHFDTWQTRQAVGDLMCGVGGYELFSKQLALRELSKQYDQMSARFKNLLTVASGYGEAILSDQIQVAIRNASEERAELTNQLSGLLVRINEEEVDGQGARQQQKLIRDVTRARRAVAEIEDRISTLDYEIEDSESFIGHLLKTLSEFDDASSTFYSLGQVHFEYCPACFTPVLSSENDLDDQEEKCHLCGSEKGVVPADPKALAVRLDIEMQIRESRSLQAERRETLDGLKSSLRVAQHVLRKVSDTYEIMRQGHATEREQRVADISRKIGYLDSELRTLEDRLALAAEIATLGEEKDRLNAALEKLRNEIEAIQVHQKKKKSIAYTSISDHAKSILDQDLAEQSDFGDVDHISFSFAEDWIAINDEKNRARSASGMVVLKNSFLLGLYLAALDSANFGLPRFMVLDNIEDKGMVPERVWNFQRVLVRNCEARQGAQQIIFTTSQLASELNTPKLVVGRRYTKAHRSLEFLPSN